MQISHETALSISVFHQSYIICFLTLASHVNVCKLLGNEAPFCLYRPYHVLCTGNWFNIKMTPYRDKTIVVLFLRWDFLNWWIVTLLESTLGLISYQTPVIDDEKANQWQITGHEFTGAKQADSRVLAHWSLGDSNESLHALLLIQSK